MARGLDTLAASDRADACPEAAGRRKGKAVADVSSVPRFALSLDEAAASIGVGRTAFREHVLPDLRVVHVGVRPLVPVEELKLYLERQARRMLQAELARERRNASKSAS